MRIVIAGAGLVGRSLARRLAQELLSGSKIASVDARKDLIDESLSGLRQSGDSALVLARDLEPSLKDSRQRVRVLNEKLFINRAKFARGITAWKGASHYPDANFTLRLTYGKARGYVDRSGARIPVATFSRIRFLVSTCEGEPKMEYQRDEPISPRPSMGLPMASSTLPKRASETGTERGSPMPITWHPISMPSISS